jgi:hypothetical protein
MSIGCHYGCFRLTDEGIDDPIQDLTAALQKHGVSAEAFRAPLPGETLRFGAAEVAAQSRLDARYGSARGT